MNPHSLTTPELADHLATLNDEQLVECLAQVEAADIKQTQQTIHLGPSALFYATHIGWPVFPLVPQGKRPLTTHGFKDASRDPEQIRAWWTRTPDANIGTPTGANGCGYDVIDIDGRPGIRSLSTLKHGHCPPDCSASTFCDSLGDLPPVLARAITPGGDDGPGFHYYIQPTGDGNGTSIAAGIDYRGDGGYVVIPPSLGPTDRRYTWITRPAAAA